MRRAYLPQQLLRDLRAVPGDKRLMGGVLGIQMPECPGQVILELDHIMPQVDQRQVKIIAPQVRAQQRIGCRVGRIKNTHRFVPVCACLWLPADLTLISLKSDVPTPGSLHKSY